MSKVLVAFYSDTGNTETMANAIVASAKEAGAEVTEKTFDDLQASDLAGYDAFAFGCPAKGVEELEEGTVAPFFDANVGELSGKDVVLFGSYGWGDGEWMSAWETQVKDAGANLLAEGVIANELPDDDAIAMLTEVGKKLVK